MNYNELDAVITAWAATKGLLKKGNHINQMLKVVEEIGELSSAIAKNENEAIIDAIGDSFVTLIILSRQLGLDPLECLNQAYNEIKDRKGRTENGIFIKDSSF